MILTNIIVFIIGTLTVLLNKNYFSSAITIFILSIIEILFSIENSLINATILQNTSKKTRLIYMNFGIIFSVVVVRILLPLFLLSLLTPHTISELIHFILYDATKYNNIMNQINPYIASFGSVFLTLTGLSFIVKKHNDKYMIRYIEHNLNKLFNKINKYILYISVTIVIQLLFLLHSNNIYVIYAGVLGLLIFVLLQKLEDIEVSSQQNMFLALIKLEIIDASLSLDSITACYLFTQNIFLIIAGLSIGAIYTRYFTISIILKKNILQKVPYLIYGAHYAMILLGLAFMLHVNEYYIMVVTIMVLIYSIFKKK